MGVWEACDEGTCLVDFFAGDDLEAESGSQACKDEAPAAEQHVWNLLGDFVKAENAKVHGKRWEMDEEDAGTLSEASFVSSGWPDGPESTEADSMSSTASVCSSMFSMDNMVDYFSPEETIIIFDWDDTICPTTALNEDFTLEVGDESLEELVYEARKTLEKAREMAAEVVIVTNGAHGWVESSCQTWLPGLWPTLDMIEFTSARAAWEPMGIETPTGWKAAAFEDIIRRFYSRYSQQSWKNVIVIGDACYEHEALSQVASLAPQGPAKRCRAKSVRFTPQPSLEVLTRELQMLRESFDGIVNHDDNLDFCFQSEQL